MGRLLRRTGIVGLGLLLVVGFLSGDVLFPNVVYGGDPYPDRELQQLMKELGVARREFGSVKKSKVSETELQAASDRLATDEERIRRRSLQLAKEYPNTKAELSVLYWVAGKWPETVEGKHALETLIKVSATANIEHLGQTFDVIHASRKESMRPLVPVLLQRERENSNHPYAAKLLTEACFFLVTDQGTVVPDEFSRIADIFVERHATSPKLANFCELLGGGEPWAQPFESHLRRILDVNEDRYVRVSAHFALASIVRSHGASRQEEAQEIYQAYLKDFDGQTIYLAQGIEQDNRQETKQILKIMSRHGIGMTAPETIGVDLDGTPLSLKDYRGKVVLVSFWATWCKPCIDAIPHERDLLETFGDSDFAIFGVNADKDIEKAKAAIKEHDISHGVH
ncbi:MAG: TlpA family protein disulfide reductase [Planctomycetes bacterium]|nr:TlpA family protein disulfide reductase [Planctomycetota bacterium]